MEQTKSRVRAQTQRHLSETSLPYSMLPGSVAVNFREARAESSYTCTCCTRVYSRRSRCPAQAGGWTGRKHPAQCPSYDRCPINVSDPMIPPALGSFLLPHPCPTYALLSPILLPLIERRCLQQSCNGDKQSDGSKRTTVQERAVSVMVGIKHWLGT